LAVASRLRLFARLVRCHFRLSGDRTSHSALPRASLLEPHPSLLLSHYSSLTLLGHSSFYTALFHGSVWSTWCRAEHLHSDRPIALPNWCVPLPASGYAMPSTTLPLPHNPHLRACYHTMAAPYLPWTRTLWTSRRCRALWLTHRLASCNNLPYSCHTIHLAAGRTSCWWAMACLDCLPLHLPGLTIYTSLPCGTSPVYLSRAWTLPLCLLPATACYTHYTSRTAFLTCAWHHYAPQTTFVTGWNSQPHHSYAMNLGLWAQAYYNSTASKHSNFDALHLNLYNLPTLAFLHLYIL